MPSIVQGLDLPVPGRIVRRLQVLVGGVVDDVDVRHLILGQETRVVVQTEEVGASLDEQLLIGRESGQPRLGEPLLGALRVDL